MFKGNKVFLEDRNGRKKQAWFVPFAGFFGFWFFIPAFGLSVKFKGKNSTITLGLPLARFSKSKISVGNNSKVEIKSSSDIVKKLKISMADWQKCTIGRDFFTWETEIIFSIGKDIEVNIGDDCMFSKGVLIRPLDGHTIYDVNTGEILNRAKSINIGHHIWCAGDNSILKGVNIPDNCIVARGSIVTKAFSEPNSLYAGIPARMIKTGVNWRREEPDREDVLVSKDTQKIDMVYLWCDLADENFKKKKEECAKKYGVEFNANNDCRYIDNDELKYSLRSLEKFAPWINNIFIVTDEQVPKWLNTEHSKIKIVDHKDIMPESALPSFNSTAILHNIVNIEGLSEYFLYSDDDTFCCDYVSPEFFFKEGNPVCRFIKPYKDDDNSGYTNILRNGDKLLKDKFGNKLPMGLKPHHNIDAYRKSLILKCKEEFKEEIEKSSVSPFRKSSDIERAIYQKYACLTGCGIFEQTDKTNIFNRRKDSLELFSQSRKKEQKLKKFKPKLFCINDTEETTDANRRETKEFLEMMFPKKSQFEK